MSRPTLGTGGACLTLPWVTADGQVLLRMGEWNSGEALLNTVVTKAAATADRYHQATALNDLGRGLMARSRFDEALRYFEQVVAMQDLREWSIYAASLNNAGSCYQRLGQFDRAIALQPRSLDVYEHRGKRESFVLALGEMGTRTRREVILIVRPHFQRALGEAKAAGLRGEAARLAGNLASVELDLQHGEAERDNQEAQSLWLETHPTPSAYHSVEPGADRPARLLGRGADLLAQVLAAPEVPPSLLWDAHVNLATVALARKQPIGWPRNSKRP